MPIKFNNASIRVGRKTIKFSDFPRLYCDYLRTRPTTRDVETEGARLMKAKSFGSATAYSFVMSVFKWGGRTSGWVKQSLLRYHEGEKNAAKVLAKGIRRAIPSLKNGTCADAIDAIISIKGIGPAYGSKILRMLAPGKTAVYDKKLHEELNYGWDSAAYQKFCNDCIKVAAILNKNKIGTHRWKAADVEAAIYGNLD